MTFFRQILGAKRSVALLCLFVAGCGNPEVGSIEDDPDAAASPKSKAEGRFKESVPAKPARGKVPAGKSTVDEGIETR